MNWRIYLAIGVITVFSGMGLYISHLRKSVQAIGVERDKYQAQAQTVNNYLTSYEPKKQKNDTNYQGWISEADKLEVKSNCAVPIPIRDFIDRL